MCPIAKITAIVSALFLTLPSVANATNSREASSNVVYTDLFDNVTISIYGAPEQQEARSSESKEIPELAARQCIQGPIECEPWTLAPKTLCYSALAWMKGNGDYFINNERTAICAQTGQDAAFQRCCVTWEYIYHSGFFVRDLVDTTEAMLVNCGREGVSISARQTGKDLGGRCMSQCLNNSEWNC